MCGLTVLAMLRVNLLGVPQQVAKVVNEGNLLPDSYVLQLLQQRLAEGARKGEEGVLLDGFPRTRAQAEALLTFSDVQLALNLHLREEVGAVRTGTLPRTPGVLGAEKSAEFLLHVWGTPSPLLCTLGPRGWPSCMAPGIIPDSAGHPLAWRPL